MGSIIGIDPGVHGAIAVITPGPWTISVIDTPKRVVEVAGKDRNEIDIVPFATFLQAQSARLLVSEKVHSRPTDGVKQAFSFGRCFGQIEMATALLKLPHLLPTPQAWKRRLMCSADKNLSRQRASALIPAAAPLFSRKKDDGRAEAALLALFGCFYLGLVPDALALAEIIA